MDFTGKTIGFALTGSFCTFSDVFKQIEVLKQTGADIIPIMSENSAALNTRFGNALDFKNRFEEICGRYVITDIVGAEPIGPKKLLDLLIIAPCTGNTLAKLANGITDTCVTMAAKAHLRNNRPLLISVSTNDGLSTSAGNISTLLCKKNVFFVPFGQDDKDGKPNSLIAKLSMLLESSEKAMENTQIQPLVVQF